MNRVKQWTVDSSQLIRAPLEYPDPRGVSYVWQAKDLQEGFLEVWQ